MGLPSSYGWIPSLAQHMFFDLKNGSEKSWSRLEVTSGTAYSSSNVVRHREIDATAARSRGTNNRPIHLLGVARGERAKRAVAELERLAKDYPDSHNYRAWAGPNSNTFVDRLARATGVRCEPHHNALGKDYTPLIRIGGTTTGTGLELETWLGGLQVGLEEGIELHLIQLTFGIDFWPPAIKLPFLPRLGFAPRH